MTRNIGFRRIAALASATAFLAVIGCSSTRYERSMGEYVDDQVLNRRVSHALNDQPVYKYPDVHVHSYRGVVQLSGFVASDAQKSAAAEIVQRVRGVTQVDNAIAIAPVAQDNTGRDFIPGRDNPNNVNRISAGAPSAGAGVTVSTGTNDYNRTFTNDVNRVR